MLQTHDGQLLAEKLALVGIARAARERSRLEQLATLAGARRNRRSRKVVRINVANYPRRDQDRTGKAIEIWRGTDPRIARSFGFTVLRQLPSQLHRGLLVPVLCWPSPSLMPQAGV